MTPSKVIVTDCDGVLLDWEFAFDVWVAEKGYKRLPGTEQIFWAGSRYGIHNDDVLKLIYEFNESACIGFLPALRDAQYYVKALAQQGFVFDVVSSLHVDRYAQMLRINNLTHLFGDVFRKINAHLSITGTKEDFLRENYGKSGCWWVEDRMDHADSGAKVGMQALLMDHPYNQEYRGNATRVKNWQDIHDMLTGNSFT